MGLIDNIRKKFPWSSNPEPEADLSVDDFQTDDSDSDQGDGDQSGAGDETDDQQDGQGGDNDNSDGDEQEDGDQQDGQGGDSSDEDGDEDGTDENGDESGSGDENGESDDESGQSEGEDDGSEGDEQDGEAGGDTDGNSDSEESDSQDDGGESDDPLSEEDNTQYDDERHDTDRITPDELARERDDMLSLSRKKDVKSFWGVDDREDVSEVETRFVRNWQKIKVAEQADEDSLLTRKKERDERMRRPAAAIDHQRIRETVMQDGLADEIEEAFRELKTRDRYKASTVGEDLDMDGVITNRSLGYETRPNYKHKQRAEKGDRAIGVSLDMSNSMHEEKAKVALGGLYVAADIIGDTITASAFHSGSRSGGNRGVYTPLITGPDEDFNWSHLDAIRPNNWTPTASGVIDAKKLLKQASRPEKVLIVITDGKPNVAPDGDTSGNKGLDTAASAVEQARHEGIKVIGLGVGNIDEGNMKAIFGYDGYVMSTMDNLARDLLHTYKKQMKVVQDM